MSQLRASTTPTPIRDRQDEHRIGVVGSTATAADSLIRSVDRVLHPKQDEPFVLTCGGLSRLRGKTA